MAYPGAPYEDAIVGRFKVGRALVGKIWLLEGEWVLPGVPLVPLDLVESVCTDVGLDAAVCGEIVLVPAAAVETGAVAIANVAVGLHAALRGELVLAPVAVVETGLLARACSPAELAAAGTLMIGLASSDPVEIVLEEVSV